MDPNDNTEDQLDERGLTERLAEFTSNPEDYSPKDAAEPFEIEQEPEEVAKPEEKPKPAEKPKEEPEEEEEQEDFPEIGNPGEKPAEKPPEEFDEATFDKQTEDEAGSFGKKAGEKWKSLRSELKQHKQELAEARKQPAQTQVPDEIKQELEALRAKAEETDALRERNNELLRVNDDVAVRESDEFITKVRSPLKEMDEVLAQISESAGIELDDLASVILEKDIVKQDKMIEELETRLGRRVAGRIERLSDDFKAIKATERSLLENASKTIAKSREQREQAQHQEQEGRVKQFKASAETSFKSYGARIPGFTDSSGNLTDLAKSVMAKTAAIDPQTLAPQDLGYMAFSANALPEIRKEVVRLQKENALLKASKGSGGNIQGKAPKGETTDDADDYTGLAERMKGMDFTFSPA